MQITTCSVHFTASFFYLGPGESLKTEQPKMTVTTDELLGMLKSKSVKLIDVRNPWELENEGKISGSVNIPCKLNL